MKKIVFRLYVLTVFIFSVFSYVFIDKNLIYLNVFYTGLYSVYRNYVGTIYLTLLVMLHILYLVLIRLYLKKIIGYKEIIFLITITIILLFFSYPTILSYDIFNYIATAKVAFLYGENPYVVMPIEFINDPILLFMHAANKTALYGPVWIGLTLFPHILGFGNFLLTLFSFKLVIAGFYILSNILIYKLVKNWFSVIIFALHPLVIIETLISGHNDIVMIGLVLIAYLLLKKKRILFAAIFLFLSIGIKFATIFLLPVFIYVSINTVRNKIVNWSKVYYLSSLAMFIVFLISPFREEMYPWYSIWFFVFICLSIPSKNLLVVTSLFLFGLMLRYIPFLFFGIYSPLVIQLRTAIMFLPLLIYFLILMLNKILKISYSFIMGKS